MNEKQKEDINQEVADIAEAIVQLAEVGELLRNSKLKGRAVVLLLHDITKVNKTEIGLVLEAIPRLKEYIRV